MRLLILIVYLGIGALAHLAFLGSDIDWTSAWTYAVVLGWPFWLGLIVLAIVGIGILCMEIQDRRQLARWRRENREKAAQRAQRLG